MTIKKERKRKWLQVKHFFLKRSVSSSQSVKNSEVNEYLWNKQRVKRLPLFSFLNKRDAYLLRIGVLKIKLTERKALRTELNTINKNRVLR